MTATVVGAVVSAASQASTLTVTVPMPAGVADGELLVVTARHQGSGADPLTLPAGSPWATLVNTASATNQRAMGIFALPVPVASSAPTSLTLTRSTTAGRYVAHAFRVAGADLAAFAGGGSTAYVTAAPTYTLSAWTATDAPGLALYVAAHDTVSGTPAITAPASWDAPTHLATTGSGGDSTTSSTTWLSTAARAVSSTAVPAGSATWNRGGGAGAAVGAVILDAPEPEPEPEPEPGELPEREPVAGRAVRAPTSTDWLDAAALDESAPPAYTLTATGDALTLPLDLLVPGKTYTLQLLAEAVPAAGSSHVSLVMEGSARQLQPGAAPVWLQWETTSTRPIALDVRGVETLTVHDLALTAAAPEPTSRRALPGEELSLELLLPRAGADVFVLDSSRTDRDALTASTPWPGTLVLDSSTLDESYLFVPELTEWWRPVLDDARAVSTNRGVRADGLVPIGEAGTLMAEFPNALDPRQYGIRRGTPVRLYHWPSRRQLFAGEVSRAHVTPERPGRRIRYVSTLEAVDVVGKLAGTMRYGAIIGAGLVESWRDRVARLMGSAPDVSWRVAPADVERSPSMSNTVHESSLAAHLDVAATSARGSWWAAADGSVTLCPGWPSGADVALFTDVPSADPLAWAYLDARAGWEWDAIISVVELTNLGATLDTDSGEWSADDASVTVTSATLAATYGRRAASGTVNVAAGEAEAIAAALARELTSSAPVSAVTLDALADMERTATLELFARVRAQLRGELRDAVVSRISHTVKPRRWTTLVELMEKRD